MLLELYGFIWGTTIYYFDVVCGGGVLGCHPGPHRVYIGVPDIRNHALKKLNSDCPSTTSTEQVATNLSAHAEFLQPSPRWDNREGDIIVAVAKVDMVEAVESLRGSISVSIAQ